MAQAFEFELEEVLKNHVLSLGQTDKQRELIQAIIDDPQNGLRRVIENLFRSGGLQDKRAFAKKWIRGHEDRLKGRAGDAMVPVSEEKDRPLREALELRARQIVDMVNQGRLGVESVIKGTSRGEVFRTPRRASTCLKMYEDYKGEDPEAALPLLDRAFDVVDDAALAIEIAEEYFRMEEQKKGIESLKKAVDFAERAGNSYLAQRAGQIFEEQLEEGIQKQEYAVDAYYRASLLTEDGGTLRKMMLRMIHYTEEEKAVEIANRAVDLSRDHAFIQSIADELRANLKEGESSAHAYRRAFETAPEDMSDEDYESLAGRLKEAGDHETANTVLLLLLSRLKTGRQETEAKLSEANGRIEDLQRTVAELREKAWAAPVPSFTPAAPAPAAQKTAFETAPSTPEIPESLRRARRELAEGNAEGVLNLMRTELRKGHITSESLLLIYTAIQQKTENSKTLYEEVDRFFSSPDSEVNLNFKHLKEILFPEVHRALAAKNIRHALDAVELLFMLSVTKGVPGYQEEARRYFRYVLEVLHRALGQGEKDVMEEQARASAERLGIKWKGWKGWGREEWKNFRPPQPSELDRYRPAFAEDELPPADPEEQQALLEEQLRRYREALYQEEWQEAVNHLTVALAIDREDSEIHSQLFHLLERIHGEGQADEAFICALKGAGVEQGRAPDILMAVTEQK